MDMKLIFSLIIIGFLLFGCVSQNSSNSATGNNQSQVETNSNSHVNSEAQPRNLVQENQDIRSQPTANRTQNTLQECGQLYSNPQLQNVVMSVTPWGKEDGCDSNGGCHSYYAGARINVNPVNGTTRFSCYNNGRNNTYSHEYAFGTVRSDGLVKIGVYCIKGQASEKIKDLYVELNSRYQTRDAGDIMEEIKSAESGQLKSDNLVFSKDFCFKGADFMSDVDYRTKTSVKLTQEEYVKPGCDFYLIQSQFLTSDGKSFMHFAEEPATPMMMGFDWGLERMDILNADNTMSDKRQWQDTAVTENMNITCYQPPLTNLTSQVEYQPNFANWTSADQYRFFVNTPRDSDFVSYERKGIFNSGDTLSYKVNIVSLSGNLMSRLAINGDKDVFEGGFWNAPMNWGAQTGEYNVNLFFRDSSIFITIQGINGTVTKEYAATPPYEFGFETRTGSGGTGEIIYNEFR